MTNYYMPTRMIKKKRETILNAGEDAEKLHHSNIAVGNIEWYRHTGKLAVSSKAKVIIWPAISLLCLYSREMKTCSHETCMQMLIASFVLFCFSVCVIAKDFKQYRYSSTDK